MCDNDLYVLFMLVQCYLSCEYFIGNVAVVLVIAEVYLQGWILFYYLGAKQKLILS